MTALCSAYLVAITVPQFNAAGASYAMVAQTVAEDAHARGEPAPVVMLVNPSIYNAVTDQPAIVLPSQGLEAMRGAARRYGARYLLLESLHSPAQDRLWDGSERAPQLALLWQGRDARLYRWAW
jgi:hypothetical protein